MYQTVLDTCRQNETVYAGVPAFVGAVGKLDGNVAVIRQVAQQQSGSVSQGATAEKYQASDRMIETCVKVANVLYAYGFTVNDQPLLSKVAHINKSLLYSGHANDTFTIAKNVSAEAAAHVGELKDYGIDEAELKAFEADIATFEGLLVKPHLTVEEHKLYTDNLKKAFVDADSTLYDQLDKLITLFKASAPDFYALYKTARNVVSVGKAGHREKAEKAEN
jgi:hypothetical protein